MNSNDGYKLRKIILKIPSHLLYNYEDLYDLVNNSKNIVQSREYFEKIEPSVSNRQLLIFIITEFNNNLFPNDLFFINDELRNLNNINCLSIHKKRNKPIIQNVFYRINLLEKINILDKIFNRKIAVEIFFKSYVEKQIQEHSTIPTQILKRKFVLIEGHKK